MDIGCGFPLYRAHGGKAPMSLCSAYCIIFLGILRKTEMGIGEIHGFLSCLPYANHAERERSDDPSPVYFLSALPGRAPVC